MGLWVNATDSQRWDLSSWWSLRQVVKVGLLVSVGYVDRGLNVESWWTGWLVLVRPGSRRRRGGTIVVRNVPLVNWG